MAFYDNCYYCVKNHVELFVPKVAVWPRKLYSSRSRKRNATMLYVRMLLLLYWCLPNTCLIVNGNTIIAGWRETRSYIPAAIYKTWSSWRYCMQDQSKTARTPRNDSSFVIVFGCHAPGFFLLSVYHYDVWDIMTQSSYVQLATT